MSTNPKFMDEEYIMNHIIRDMNEWTEKTEFPSIQDNVAHVDSHPLVPDTDTLDKPRHSIDITKQLAYLVKNINFQPCFDHPLSFTGTWMES